jgi:D-glycero-D-manno-heptose 1,7-bisphosphate phosphatase
VTGALFLDRDGVINVKAPDGEYVRTRGDFRLIPGAVEAVADVTRAAPDVPIVVVTNQRGVARGLIDPVELDAIHEALLAAVVAGGGRIDAIYVCPHEAGSCGCRKPSAGLFLAARRDIPDIDFARSVVVGDSLSDLEPGARLGCRTLLVGDEPRRSAVHRAAADAGVRIDGEAPSLRALVESGHLASLGVTGVGIR